MATQALLLNASFEPLSVISARRAVILVLTGKAEVVEEGEDPFRSAQLAVKIPAVLRLLRYVKVPYRRTLAISRRALLARDEGKCGYCNKPGDTIDHIVPRSRGGKHEWTNVVTACKPCNSKKDDKLLSELGWHLKIKPTVPTALFYLVLRNTGYESWEPYLATA